MKESAGERVIFLDIARIVAILAVVMIHVSAGFVLTSDKNSLTFLVANILDSVSRIGVPIFVMISGALMLKEEKEINFKIIWKKIKNLLLLLAFWSACYATFYKVFLPLFRGEEVQLKAVISNFIFGHYHLWYLFMIVGLYAITPFLRAFVKKENKNLVLYFLALSLFVQFIPDFLKIFYVYCDDLSFIVNYIEQFELKFFCGYTAYYLLGWYIVNIGFNKLKRIAIYILSFIAIIGIITVAKYVPGQAGENKTAFDLAYSNLGVMVFIYATGVFTLLSQIKNETLSIKAKNILKNVASLSFGVYIIHVFIISLMQKLFNFVDIPLLNMFAVWIATTLASFASCFVLSKIPFAKRLIRT